MTREPPPLRASLAQAAAQRALSTLWRGVIPALLAALVLRYLVPRIGSGVPGAVAALGQRYGLQLGVALFFAFSALSRHWRFRLPGGRYASALPAHLVSEETDPDRLAEWAAVAESYDRLRSRGIDRALERTLDPGKRAELIAALGDLRAGLEGGEAERARDARRRAESIASCAVAARRRRETLGLVACAAAAVGAALVLRARVVEQYAVFGESMLPTLEPADRVVGSKLAYAVGSAREPRRGDIIAFRSAAVPDGPRAAASPEVLVKRVIGLPGDRIEMRGNVPVINGWKVPSCDAGEYLYVFPDASGRGLHGRLAVEFLEDRAYLAVYAVAPSFPEAYVVKAGEVFVLGDNRSNSLDSRAYAGGHGGGVPFEAIAARARWFLFGTHRSGDLDATRLLRPVDALQAHLRLEGLETESLDEKISRCLQNRPADTRPPRSDQPSALRDPETGR